MADSASGLGLAYTYTHSQEEEKEYSDAVLRLTVPLLFCLILGAKVLN